MRTHNKMATSAAIAALALAGCGGGGGGDGSDPVSVARAYAESLYRCGERGAGVRAELAYPESAAAEHRREAGEEERPGGCKEEQPKEFQVALVSREPAVVEISNEECSRTALPMLKVDGRWLVDESQVDRDFICTPYAEDR